MVDFKSKLKTKKWEPEFDPAPKYAGWEYMDYYQLFKDNQSVRFLEPMSAQEPEEYEQGVVDIAELKYDGHRGLLFLNADGNRAFSRRVSKKTGWYNENSDQVPHIRDLIVEEYAGTVLDGEFDMGGDSMDVQSVMGALPAKAIAFQQEHGWLPYKAFDILYYKGINVQNMPLWKRKVYLADVIDHIRFNLCFPLIEFVPMYASKLTASKLHGEWERYCQPDRGRIFSLLDDSLTITESFNDLFVELVDRGIEGLIVKNAMAPYEQKRSKGFLKMKGLSTWDVVIMGYTEPTKPYEGKLIEEGRLDEWPYWYHPESDSMIELEPNESAAEYMNECDPVTKPFAKGWIGAIQCGVFKIVEASELADLFGENVGEAQKLGHWYYDKKNECYRALVHVADVKGLPDDILKDIKKNGTEYVSGMKTLEIKANGMIDKEIGSLRHPRFARWRDDKAPLSCTWEDHIRETKE